MMPMMMIGVYKQLVHAQNLRNSFKKEETKLFFLFESPADIFNDDIIRDHNTNSSSLKQTHDDLFFINLVYRSETQEDQRGSIDWLEISILFTTTSTIGSRLIVLLIRHIALLFTKCQTFSQVKEVILLSLSLPGTRNIIITYLYNQHWDYSLGLLASSRLFCYRQQRHILFLFLT
jgi:hypothetical protein